VDKLKLRSDIPDKIKVRLFANLRVSYLNNEILNKYPQLKSFSNKFVTSVNCKVTTGDTVITSGDEIALLPPVSGG
jgi:molybdopterin converting factor small subunit